jgi:hypothetical protein
MYIYRRRWVEKAVTFVDEKGFGFRVFVYR